MGVEKRPGNNRKQHSVARDEIVKFRHLCRRWCFSYSPHWAYYFSSWMANDVSMKRFSEWHPLEIVWILSIFPFPKKWPQTKTIKQKYKTYFLFIGEPFLCSSDTLIHWRKHKIRRMWLLVRSSDNFNTTMDTFYRFCIMTMAIKKWAEISKMM